MQQPEQICIHAYVTGKVQQVYFRAFTEEQACAAGVSGWVRNLEDGRVEVLLEGGPQAVETVLRALYTGPQNAEVLDLEYRQLPASGNYDNFSVR